jgi:hypothetical protein
VLLRMCWRMVLMLVLFCATALTGVVVGSTSAGAAGIVPPQFPPADIPAHIPMDCAFSPDLTDNPACDGIVLSDIDYARGLEGIGPMNLPPGYFGLGPPQQMFVVANLERQDRGLPPLGALDASLSVDALQGAEADGDPTTTDSNDYGSNWAGGFNSVLSADYGWMYDDGPGGSNFECQPGDFSGCWGHRQNVLISLPDPVLGAAVTTTGGFLSWAELLSQAPVVGMAATSNGGGYWLADSAGGVQAFGGVAGHGSMAGVVLNSAISHIVSTPDGKGYWLVAGDGGTFAFGDAGFYGSMGGRPLNAPVVDIAPTADGRGYWLVASDGGVFAFGDARFHGSMGGLPLNRPVVGIAADKHSGGYWEAATDGGIFAFGAPFFGSTGNLHLTQPVLSMAPTANDAGYWFVASDGGIFAYGNAAFHGSLGGVSLYDPVVGMSADWATGGYWMVDALGSVSSFAAPNFGSRLPSFAIPAR